MIHFDQKILTMLKNHMLLPNRAEDVNRVTQELKELGFYKLDAHVKNAYIQKAQHLAESENKSPPKKY
jgi:hypothetical protein